MTEQTTQQQLRADALRNIAYNRKAIVLVRQHAKLINKIGRTIAATCESPRAFTYNSGPRTYVTFKGDINGLESLKSPALVKKLARIERASGAEFNQSYDASWIDLPSRRFSTTLYIEHDLAFEIEITAVVRAGAPTCRRVKVGERTYTEGVYEIQCD